MKYIFLDAGEFEYLDDQKELAQNFGMWKYLRIKVFRLVVFRGAPDKNKICFEALEERKEIGFRSKLMDSVMSRPTVLEGTRIQF